MSDMQYDALGNPMPGASEPIIDSPETAVGSQADWERFKKNFFPTTFASLLEIPTLPLDIANAARTYGGAAFDMYSDSNRRRYTNVGGPDLTWSKAIEQNTPEPDLLDKASDSYKDWVVGVTGAPKIEDRTVEENVLGVLSQSLVPGGQIGALDKLGKGGKIINKGLQAIEDVPLAKFVDPRTSHYTAGGIATNAGIGSAVTIAVDTAVNSGDSTHVQSGTPTHIDAGKTELMLPKWKDMNGKPLVSLDLTPQSPEEEMTHGQRTETFASTAGVAMAMPLFALLAGRRVPAVAGAARSGIDAMAERGAGGVVRGGAGYVPDAPVSSPAKFAIDEMAPAKEALKTVGLNDTQARDFVAETTKRASLNSSADVDMFRFAGNLTGVDRKIKPIAAARNFMNEVAAQHGPQEVDAMRTWISDLDALGNRERMLTNYQHEIDGLEIRQKFLQNEIQTLQPGKELDRALQEHGENQAKVAQLQSKLDARTNDTPETRPNRVDLSDDELKQNVELGFNRPHFVEFKSYFDDWRAARLEHAVARGIMDPNFANELSARADDYVPLVNDPFGGKKGLARAWAKISAKFTPNEDPFGNPNLGTMTDPMRVRELEWDSEKIQKEGDTRANVPIDPIDAYDLVFERDIRFANKNQFRKEFVEKILSSPKWADVLEQYQPNKAPIMSREAFAHHMQDKNTPLGRDPQAYTTIVHPNGVQVVKFKDPLLALMMRQDAAFTIPVMREFNRWWRIGTTGANSAFAPKAAWLDLSALQATRKTDSVFGTDAMAAMAFGKSPQWLSVASKSLGNADPGAYMMTVQAAVSSFIRQNEQRIGTALAGELEASSDFFKMVKQAGDAAGVGNALETLGRMMVRNYGHSLYDALTENHVAANANVRAIRAAQREIDQVFGNARMPKSLKYAISPMGEIVAQYRMMVHAIESAARVNYAHRNLMVAAQKYGGDWTKVPAKEFKRIVTDARTRAADFAVRPGSKVVQGMNSAMPYTNVMLRSSGALYRAIRENPKTMLPMMLSGALVPKLYSEYLMANWDDQARDYWYNQTPDWKRVGTYTIPKPHVVLAWAQGRNVPFTPDAVYTFNILNEMRPLTSVVSEGMRALGAFGSNAYSKLIPASPGKDIASALGEGMKQAFSPVTPPAIGGMLGMFGQKFDMGNMFTSPGEIVAPISRGDDSGRFSQFNVSSEIPKNVGNAIGGFFGGGGLRLLEAFDTGMQTYVREKDQKGSLTAIADAVSGAVGEFKGRTTESAKTQSMPGLWNANEKVYSRTPLSEHVNEMRRTIALFYGPNASIKKTVGDPVLDNIMNTMRFSMRNNLKLNGLSKQFSQVNKELQAVQANRLMSYNDRQKMVGELNKEKARLTTTQAELLNAQVARLQKVYSPQYKQKFGVEFSFSDFKTRLQDAQRSQIAQTQPRRYPSAQ